LAHPAPPPINIEQENPDLPDDVIDALYAEQDAQEQRVCTVYRCNVPALDAFLVIRQQNLFRYHGLGGILGLDWQQITHCPLLESTQAEHWWDVTEIAYAYINEMSEK